MGSTNTWSVSGSVAGAAFYFRCCSSFDNKESPSNIRGRLGCKGSNGRRIEVVKRDEERERENGCWKREWKGVAYAAATITWRIQRSLILPLCTCKRCVKGGGRVKCTRKVPIFEGCTPCLITPDMDGRKPTLWLSHWGGLMVFELVSWCFIVSPALKVIGD